MRIKEIPADGVRSSLALGDHLVPGLLGARYGHVNFDWVTALACVEGYFALVDVNGRRIVWFSVNPVDDPAICGGKVKEAQKAYARRYGAEHRMVWLYIEGGRVTSHQWRTQKFTYRWDWALMRQVQLRGGRKYAADGNRT
ncbi:MAG TPA: hypothetical protein VG028_13310 [Terriglobia bacterium]|nr:hypothetical protein [Terriglobia bacterium]